MNHIRRITVIALIISLMNISGCVVSTDEDMTLDNISPQSSVDEYVTSDNKSSQPPTDEYVTLDNVSSQPSADEYVTSDNISSQSPTDEDITSANVSSQLPANEYVTSANVSSQSPANEYVTSANVTSQSPADENVPPPVDEYVPTEAGNMTTMEYVRSMGVGINLGNTFDCIGDWFDKTVKGQETAWGSPVITKNAIEGYADGGFGVMRLPVSWTTLADEEGNIPDEFMDRIEEVVNWILNSGMKCILNTHHDGWEKKFSENYDEAMKLYEKIWTQIAQRFKNYDDNLMFESMNEVGFDDIWNQYGGTEGKQEAFDIFNSINQKFVDLIRSSDGCNKKRHLLIAAYWTSSVYACDDMFIIPNDPVGRLAVSIHYYNPSTLCILTEDADWGKARTDWGSEKDYKELYGYFDEMKEHFIDKNIPVIIGEYGCFGNNKTREVREQWMLDVAAASCERQMCPILWDTKGDEFDREKAEYRNPGFIKKIVSLTDT